MKFVATVTITAFALLFALGGLAQTETRTSNARGVTVKVTPKALSAAAATWEFVVVLDTHSQDLSDDLTKSASIVSPDGTRQAPIAWQDAAADGHHREGILRFQAPNPAPSVIELQIQRPAESEPRVFRWNLN
jgi:hypothetical protein